MARTRFDPRTDGFGFDNTWQLDLADAERLRAGFRSAVDAVVASSITAVAGALGRAGIGPAIAAEAVKRVTPQLRNEIVDSVIKAAAGDSYGMCGGMAFAGRDYFDAGLWPPVTEGQPTRRTPEEAALRDYIWTRLIDSLDLNGLAFVDWLVTLYVLPHIAAVALGIVVAAESAAAETSGGVLGDIVDGITSVASAISSVVPVAIPVGLVAGVATGVLVAEVGEQR